VSIVDIAVRNKCGFKISMFDISIVDDIGVQYFCRYSFQWGVFYDLQTLHLSTFSTIMGSEAILVLGSQFGDEGKGKLIDIIAAERDIWYVEVTSKAEFQPLRPVFSFALSV
jgi:hypothetical protein